jgi:hypothetical protein
VRRRRRESQHHCCCHSPGAEHHGRQFADPHLRIQVLARHGARSCRPNRALDQRRQREAQCALHRRGTAKQIKSRQSCSPEPPKELFASALFDQGESWTAKFDKPGRFAYICDPHPFMKAVIIVE